MLIFLRKIGFLSAANIFSAILSFLYIPIIIKGFGLSLYGQLVIAQTVLGIAVALSNTQSWQGIIQFNSNGFSSYKPLIKIMIMDFSIGLLMMIIAITTFEYYYAHLGIDKANSEALLFILLSIVFFPCNMQVAVIRISKKYEYQAIVETICNIIKFSLILTSVSYNSIYILIFSFVIPDVIKFVLFTLLAFMFLPIDKSTKENIPDVYKFSSWAWIANIVQLPINQLDKVIFSLIFNAETLGIYNVIKRVVSALVLVTMPISHVMYPELRRLVKLNNREQYINIITKTTFALVVVLVAWYFILNLSSSVWLRLFFNDADILNFKDMLSAFLLSLSFIYFISQLSSQALPAMLSMGLAKKNMLVTLGSNILYLLIIYLTYEIIGFYSVILALLMSEVFLVLYKCILIKKNWEKTWSNRLFN